MTRPTVAGRIDTSVEPFAPPEMNAQGHSFKRDGRHVMSCGKPANNSGD